MQESLVRVGALVVNSRAMPAAGPVAARTTGAATSVRRPMACRLLTRDVPVRVCIDTGKDVLVHTRGDRREFFVGKVPVAIGAPQRHAACPAVIEIAS